MDKPIPAFYACYLLRSTIRHASLYVGSTPNPVRRLKQHNGESKGGAVKTSKDSLRPWEMTCLVTGFPSKIAALQFEWAWQHTHLTRHVSPNSRLSRAKDGGTRLSPKSGRLRKRPGKPRVCLTDRLANLHLLLRSSSFERWPLRVTFYAEDVFKIWQRWLKQDPARDGGIRDGIEVGLCEGSASATGAEDVLSGIQALDVGYAALKPRLKSSKVLLEAAELCCTLCKAELPSTGAGVLVCTHDGCRSTTHLTCLAKRFLAKGVDKAALLPTQGNCAACQGELHWVDLVKELSLRMRGEKEIEALFKVPRVRKQKAATSKADVLPEDDEDEEVCESDELPDELMLPEGEQGKAEWAQLPDTSDIEKHDGLVMRSEPNPLHRRKAADVYAGPSKSEPVVEDSDWDDADILT